MIKLLFPFFLSIILISCKENPKVTKKLATIKLIEKEYNFGQVTIADTINHIFKVKNLTTIPFKIYQTGTSCGCTTSNFTKDEVRLNEFAIIEVRFIPTKDKIGKVKESVVVDCNVQSGFLTFYLTGEIKK